MRAHILVVMVVFSGSVSCGGSSASPPSVPPAAGGAATEEQPSTSSFAAPGDCVDPLVDGDKHDPSRPFDKHVQLDVRDEDLDGDGHVDVFVKPAWSCGDSCKRSAYVSRGTCAHYVGSFLSVDRYETLGTSTKGLKDLSVRPRRVEGDGVHCYQEILKFDGKQYQTAKSRECDCASDPPKCEKWPE